MAFQPIGDLLSGPVSESLGQREDHCQLHGAFTTRGMRFLLGKRREHWSGCPACAGEVAEKERLARMQVDAAEQAVSLERMLGQTALPERFRDRTFDNYQVEAGNKLQARALGTCRKYVDVFDSKMLPEGTGLILMGQRGTGKSHLAGAILKGLLPRHVGVYTTFMAMLHSIRATYDKGSLVTERQVIERLSSVPLLVIDEIGVQRGTDDEHIQLFGIIDNRYGRKLPTILLTNQDEAGIERFVGDRLYDRLVETSHMVKFDWASHRRPPQ